MWYQVPPSRRALPAASRHGPRVRPWGALRLLAVAAAVLAVFLAGAFAADGGGKKKGKPGKGSGEKPAKKKPKDPDAPPPVIEDRKKPPDGEDPDGGGGDDGEKESDPLEFPPLWKDAKSWKTYKVTDLGMGKGGLKDALEQASGDKVPSRIVFTVGGVIAFHETVGYNDGDLVIDGLTAPDPGIAVEIGFTKHGSIKFDSRRTLVRGLTILNSGGDGMTFAQGKAKDAMIDRCTLLNNFDEGVAATEGTRNLIIANCRFEGNGTPSSNGRNLLIGKKSSAIVVNSVFRYGLRGMTVNDGSFLDLRNCRIEGSEQFGFSIAGAASANVVDCVLDKKSDIHFRDGRLYVKGTQAEYSVEKANVQSPISEKDTPFPDWLELKTPSGPAAAGAPSYPKEIRFPGSLDAYLALRPSGMRKQ